MSLGIDAERLFQKFDRFVWASTIANDSGEVVDALRTFRGVVDIVAKQLLGLFVHAHPIGEAT